MCLKKNMNSHNSSIWWLSMQNYVKRITNIKYNAKYLYMGFRKRCESLFESTQPKRESTEWVCEPGQKTRVGNHTFIYGVDKMEGKKWQLKMPFGEWERERAQKTAKKGNGYTPAIIIWLCAARWFCILYICWFIFSLSFSCKVSHLLPSFSLLGFFFVCELPAPDKKTCRESFARILFLRFFFYFGVLDFCFRFLTRTH